LCIQHDAQALVGHGLGGLTVAGGWAFDAHAADAQVVQPRDDLKAWRRAIAQHDMLRDAPEPQPHLMGFRKRDAIRLPSLLSLKILRKS
jgi:hypothetical protein